MNWFLLLVFGLCLWFWISIPAFFGKWRGISADNLITVRILAFLGIITAFVTWFIALFLACTYPAVAQPPQPAFPVAPIAPQPEQCANCGRVIGQLETPMVWGNSVVCRQCYQLLV